MTNQQSLGEESISKLLIKYSIPAIIGMMVNALYNVVDRMFIGNIPDVGPLAITGVGVTMPIMTVMLAFAMLIGIGATTNISIQLGMGNKENARKIIGNSITLSIITGISISIVGIVFADEILTLLGASNETMYYAKSYIYIILLGSTFSILAFTLNNTIRGDGNPKLAAIIMVVGCITNIVLDYLLIFVFNMGIQGAAIATVVSQVVTAIWGLMYYTTKKSNLVFEVKDLKLDKKLLKLIASIGIAPFSMQIATSLVQVIANNSLKIYGGDLAIGAMATISSISMIFLMPVMGVNQGAQPIIGFNFGARKYNRSNEAYKMSAIIATVIMTSGWLVVQSMPEVVIGMFNKDPELMEISVEGLRIYLLVFPVIGISITGSNYIQSVGKAKTAMILSLMRQVIILIPVMSILPKFIGLNGIWLAQPISDLITTIITGYIVIKELKKYKKLYEEENKIVNELAS